MKEVISAINKVMSEIGVIAKDRKAPKEAGGYAFRGIDDAYEALQPLLVKHKLIYIPEVIESTREERASKSGGTLIYTILRVKYTFYVQNGDSLVSVVEGEGMDSGDKSTNKAMSGALKYLILQVFCIPTQEKKDSEHDSPEVEPKSDEDKAKEFIERIEQCKNIFELKNWHKKHLPEIKKLSPEFKNEVIKIKDAQKTFFENQEIPPPEEITTKEAF
ncbi:MAG: single-stranded DNA-binding protein [Gammaproteobacteria bacterium]|nr:single-stranded DNA-binding protein [Gammaproteobacteria bacterium]